MKAFLYALAAVTWFGIGVPDAVAEENVCDTSARLVAANRADAIDTAKEKKPGQQLKIVAVDTKQSSVTAQPTNSREVLTFQLTPTAVKSLRAGQVVGIDYLAANGTGKRVCPCGKKGDGSCWCTGEKPCCGPLAGCPIGSCDKKQPIPNAGDKPIFEGTPGSGGK